MPGGGGKGLAGSHSRCAEIKFVFTCAAGLHLKTRMINRLTDGKEGIIHIINRINSCHHENGKIVPTGVCTGAFEIITGSVEIDNIFGIQGTGAGLGISGCVEVVSVSAFVSPLTDRSRGIGDAGRVGGIEPQF